MREKANLKHNMKKEGIIMKSTRTTEKIVKICTILPGILALAMVVLLCMPYTIQNSYAQVSSGSIGWYGAMAMGNIAERERRIEEQKAAEENEKRIAAIITVPDNDNKAYGNGPEEKDLAEK
ncbi:MAG: hypothetical protein ACXACY_28565 [Candidatus Hodarchaeales archaeon]|jgi:hypothetical protein